MPRCHRSLVLAAATLPPMQLTEQECKKIGRLHPAIQHFLMIHYRTYIHMLDHQPALDT